MTTHLTTQLSNTEATRLTPIGVHSGMDITIQNLETEGFIYIGGEGVDSESFGYRIAPATAWSIELPGTDALYAISESNGAYIAVLKTGLENGN